MDCLYISHTGMTEPLGRSQVLPYVMGLARRGFEIDILSHEPSGTSEDDIAKTRALVDAAGVGWLPQVRSPEHALRAKVWEAGRAATVGLTHALRKRPRIVHARSYLPAAVADVIASVTPGAKMLFDCRGMLGDEYVDAGHWTEARIEYRLLKRFERRAFRRSDGIVVLTEALRRWLRERELVPAATPIEVVPCCVETERFGVDEAVRRDVRASLGLGDRLVLVYSGTLGSWYQEKEMARLAALLRRRRPDLAWVVFTRADTTSLLAAARAEGIEDVIVRPVAPRDMPRMLTVGDVGVSFIRSCFSKLGSSPTKVAEYFAAGMTVVVNSGVGDQGDLGAHPDACVVASSQDDDELDRVARRAIELADRPLAARVAAAQDVLRSHFSLSELGVPRYEALYRQLLGPRVDA